MRVGVYSLYFPSMLKPVPIRLRAGLWMIARNRDTIPPLPIEGRTSMDLPQGAERDFYGAIGYLPLGNHAIRADMVERLAAMARAAVRESRENARRAQQEKQEKREPRERPERRGDARTVTTAEAAAPPIPAPATDAEISEWAIVAAAFGENDPTPEPAGESAPVSDAEPVAEAAPVGEAALERPTPTPAVEAEADARSRSPRLRPRPPTRPKRPRLRLRKRRLKK